MEDEAKRKVEEQLKKQTAVSTHTGPPKRKYGGEGALQRKLEAMNKVKVVETDPGKMKTYPRIPFQRAIKLRPRAPPMEAERFFTLLFE